MRVYHKRVTIGVGLVVALACAQLAWADAASDAYDEGARLLREGQHRDAIPAFDKALRLNPRYAEAYNARGVTYNEMAQYERAVKDYDAALILRHFVVCHTACVVGLRITRVQTQCFVERRDSVPMLAFA